MQYNARTVKKMFSDPLNFTGSVKEEQNIKLEPVFNSVIPKDTIQDLEEITGITLIIKIAEWKKSILAINMSK